MPRLVPVTRQQRLTLIATILGSTVVFLDGTVVNVALPAISDGLDVGLAGQQWVVEAYTLALVSLLLVGGSLGDQFGRRRIFVMGLISFGVCSALCAIAPTAEFLIGARALQGIAGALLVPGSLAIVAATFSGEARGKAVGTWTAWTGIATVLGPAGGGALISLVSWRAIFWVNIPLIAVTGFLTLRSVQESRDEDAFLDIDFLGIVLSAIGLGGPTFALIEQPANGWSSPMVWLPMVVGIASFILFIVREAYARHPLLPLGLFKIRNFSIANLTTLSAYAGLIGGLFFVGLFLQQVAGYSPLEAGLATTPISVLMFFLSPRFGKVASGTGPRLPMSAGPIVGGIGLLLLLRVGSDPELRDRRPSRPADLRRRALGDGRAADGDRARLRRRTPRGNRLGRQQRCLQGRRPARDRDPRRGDLRPLRHRARQPAGQRAALWPGRERGLRRQGKAPGGAGNRRADRRRSDPCRSGGRPTRRPPPSTSGSGSPGC